MTFKDSHSPRIQGKVKGLWFSFLSFFSLLLLHLLFFSAGKGTMEDTRRASFLPLNIAWHGKLLCSCNVWFGWFNLETSCIICKTCWYVGREGKRVTSFKVLRMIGKHKLYPSGQRLTPQQQKPLMCSKPLQVVTLLSTLNALSHLFCRITHCSEYFYP